MRQKVLLWEVLVEVVVMMIRARYQPNWVRNVDRAIGTSGRFLQGRLEEQDGDQTSEQLADVLRDYLRAMGVSGGP